jgi:hypothetical protein
LLPHDSINAPERLNAGVFYQTSAELADPRLTDARESRDCWPAALFVDESGHDSLVNVLLHGAMVAEF